MGRGIKQRDQTEVSPILPERQQKYLRRYLRELDRSICDLLSDSGLPLKLAGDSEICDLYCAISAYPHLELAQKTLPIPAATVG